MHQIKINNLKEFKKQINSKLFRMTRQDKLIITR